MKNKIYTTLDEAVGDVPDGATIMFPGFVVGNPSNLIEALHRQGAKDLTGISNEHGGDDQEYVGILVAAGQFKKLICAFTAATHPSRVTPFVQLYVDSGTRFGWAWRARSAWSKRASWRTS